MEPDEVYAAAAKMIAPVDASREDWFAGLFRFNRFCAGLPDEGGRDWSAEEKPDNG